MRFRFCAPLAANPRVKNLFKRAPFRRVLKHYTAKFFPIQLLIGRKNRSAKFASNLFSNLRIKIDKLVRGIIRVEKFGTGDNLA